MVAKLRVSDARRAGSLSDGTRIVAYISALPMSMPHTRSRYSGSSVTSSSSLPSPFWTLLHLPGGTARGTGGERKKLTRVLEATINGPLYPAPGVRLTRGLNRDQVENDVTGGTAAIFHAGTAPRAAASGADPKIGAHDADGASEAFIRRYGAAPAVPRADP